MSKTVKRDARRDPRWDSRTTAHVGSGNELGSGSPGRGGSQPPAAPPGEEKPKKRHRIFWWFFVAIQAAFIVWLILGGLEAQGGSCEGLPPQECQDAKDVGTTIGVGLIIGLWAAVDIIVGGTYAVYRLTRRRR
ncbi:hypothetical protein ACQEU8_30345 [Streptomyces sp. CA-250714]|uniref:hypothetical protein n=1 Tax=Streptomyces sp. CA-250714 TaxID=3240060 RepID=UPI003D8C46DA